VDAAESQTLRPQPVRYPGDLTDEEWAHVAPLIPPAKPGGNKRTVDVREVMNGVMFRRRAWYMTILYCGVATALSIASTMHSMSRAASRRNAKRAPTAAMIDSQSVKSAEKGGLHRSAWL
jgi:transposase